ncbi:MAG: hypothetical protein ABJN26_00845 [Stappiaceae bacterium]
MSEDASSHVQEPIYADDVPLLWNCRVLLLRGLSWELVHRLGSINTVLPFIFISIEPPVLSKAFCVPTQKRTGITEHICCFEGNSALTVVTAILISKTRHRMRRCLNRASG